MTKKIISRGFHGRRQQGDVSARLPPGQYLENGFPVLSAGPTPHTSTDTWSFSIWEGGQERKHWTWDEFQTMPQDEVTADIHCVTKWSKFDTHWRGVSVDRVLEGIDSNAHYVMAASDGGYTTNLPLEDVRHGQAWIVWQFEGRLSLLNTAGRHDCWFHTSISGKAPNGFAVFDCSNEMRLVSGNRLVITITVIRGKKNGIGETELASG